MELTIHIDDSDIAPGHYLTGTLTLHLTAHYPPPQPPSPTHPTPYDTNPALLYHHQLAAHHSRLLHSAPGQAPQLLVTGLLERLQLQVVGRCLVDVGKVPKGLLQGMRLGSGGGGDGQSLNVLTTAAVTLERFDRPLPFDLLHQPYTCQQTATSASSNGAEALISPSLIDSSR